MEKPEELIFTNMGSFIPKTVEAVIEQDAPQEYYRNHFLATAMVELNMIDTIGSGIKKMFTLQRKRFFPMPDYDLSESDKVKVKILGKVLDINYTKALINNTMLDLKTVINLDKVQKRERLTLDEYKALRAQKLVEGRYPNVFVAANIADITGDKTSYIKNRAFDDEYYKKLVIELIKKFGSATRKDIDDLLMDKLSDTLNEKQRKNKIKNLIYDMSRKEKTIKNIGSDAKSIWVLIN